MNIKFSPLKEGRHSFFFEGPISEISLNEPFIGNYSLHIDLEKSVHQILLFVKGTANAALICDRCSKNYRRGLDFQYEMIYLFDRNHQGLSADNITYLTPETDKIELDQDIYDFANLALPMKQLCSDDCRGMCPQCGSNLNDSQCLCAENEKEKLNSPFSALRDYFNDSKN
jgi:uncharacterized protein